MYSSVVEIFSGGVGVQLFKKKLKVFTMGGGGVGNVFKVRIEIFSGE